MILFHLCRDILVANICLSLLIRIVLRFLMVILLSWSTCTFPYRWPFTLNWTISFCRIEYKCNIVDIHYLPNHKSQSPISHQWQSLNNSAKFKTFMRHLRHTNLPTGRFEYIIILVISFEERWGCNLVV